MRSHSLCDEVARCKFVAYGCIDWIEVEQFAPLNFLCVPLWSQQSRSAPINFGIGNPDSMNCEAPLVNARGIKQIKAASSVDGHLWA